MTTLIEQAKIIYNEQQVQSAISKMAQTINQDLADKKPLLLCVVNGGIFLTGQLLPKLKIALELDYIHISRYGNALEGQSMRWLAKPSTPLKERNIVILDDVLDQGITLKAIEEYCQSQGAKSIYHAVLFDKTECRASNGVVTAHCIGLTAPNEYLFGCGLDVKGFFRNTPSLYSVPPALIPKIDELLP